MNDYEHFKKQYANVDPCDYYLMKQKIYDIRMTELRTFISKAKAQGGMVKHRHADKLRDATKMIERLEQMKDEDSMPWEQGPTYYFSVLGVEP